MPAFPLPEISGELRLGEIRHPYFSARDLRLSLAGAGGQLTLGQVEIGGQHWRALRLVCARLGREIEAFHCTGGTLHLPGVLPLTLDLRQKGTRWRLQLRTKEAEEHWDLRYEPSGMRLLVRNGAPDLLVRLVPQLAPLQAWKLSGRFSGEIHLAMRPEGQVLSGKLALEEGGFSAPDALRAAEKLAATLEIQGREHRGLWHLEGGLIWQGGLVYHDPLLIQSEGQSLRFSGTLAGETWTLHAARFDWPQIGQITLAAHGNGKGIQEGRLDAALALAPLGERLLRPVLASRDFPVAELSGELTLRADWESGRLAQLELRPQEGGFRLQNGRFGFAGLTGRLLWRQEGAGEGEFTVGELRLGRVASSAFPLSLAVWPRGFALVRPVTIPILESRLVIQHLAAGVNAELGELEGALGLSLHPVPLERLTEALELPRMQGLLAAELPAIRYRKHEAALDGALAIQVFDGYLYCNELRLIEPFGERSRLIADVEARHIDLEQLTRTFSFGQVSGFVDAHLTGLELADRRALAFDARIESSPGNYRKRISQRAVDHIAALGGGGAVAAIQASALRFFQDFGYRRIGLACRLENGVCQMQGIAGMEQGTRYTIIEGGGIPALTVQGYNRRMDWEEFIIRLKAAINNQEGPLIR
ncbi:MAG: hypothetical protein LBO00_06670 [Zoogloeaceae bacterium]|nr:hypothetical protein [Zoogloeaceae bacterium]